MAVEGKSGGSGRRQARTSRSRCFFGLLCHLWSRLKSRLVPESPPEPGSAADASSDANFKLLANRLYEVIVGNLTALEVWGFYLTSADFDDEPELRNKLGALWACSLLDTMEADERYLPEIAREAQERGFSSLVHNAGQLQKFCAVVAELLGKLKRDEQIFLVDIRNQWVHSYLAGRHRATVRVKYCVKGALKSEVLSYADYHATVRRFYESGKDIH